MVDQYEAARKLEPKLNDGGTEMLCTLSIGGLMTDPSWCARSKISPITWNEEVEVGAADPEEQAHRLANLGAQRVVLGQRRDVPGLKTKYSGLSASLS